MKVNEIKSHYLFLFLDFRQNDTSFLLMEMFWTSVAEEALGEELSNQCVPLSIAEQDKDNIGSPVMLDFWIPKIQKGAKILLNENLNNLPLYSESKVQGQSVFFPLYMSVSIRERPVGHYFPAGDLISEQLRRFGEILFVANLSDEAINGVVNGLRLFLKTDISVDDMAEKCLSYERSIGALA